MTNEHRSREKLLNVREQRSVAESFEVREDSSRNVLILEGYAATYEPYDVGGGPAAGGWVEQLSTTVFDDTLASQPDLQLLINHGGEPLARTKSGTMRLSRDGHGLRVYAELDATDPDVMRLAPKMRRKDMDEMSFAFRVQDQQWDASYTHRTISQLSLHKGDVSVVNYGMNPGTKAAITEAVGALAQLSSRELQEVRSSLDTEQIKRAQAMLAQMSETRKDTVKPYGNVAYADPGYKDDGRKRYPIDTEAHAKAAWSYINMPKNQSGYSASQLDGIKKRIRTALKKFGVQVGDDGNASLSISHYDMVANAAGGTTLIAVLADGSRVALPTQRAAALGEMAQGDPKEPFNDVPAQPLVKGPADPHDMPFSKGPEVGSVPGDRPNMTPITPTVSPDGDPGPEDPSMPMPKEVLSAKEKCDDMPEESGTKEKCDDMPNECAPMDGPACDGGSGCPGDNCPDHGTNAYDPTTGEGRADAEPDPDDPNEDQEQESLNLGIAEALDRTITHAYKLAEGNEEVRQVLATARQQLNAIRGLKAPADTDIARKLTELRKEVGMPDTGSVSDGLAFLRSAGALPVGYRGVAMQDPDCHVVTAAERLAHEKADKATRATEDAVAAEARLREARRLGELNAVIARHKAG